MQIYKLMFSTGETYIGQTVFPAEVRFKQHIKALLSNTHHSIKAQEVYSLTKQLPIMEVLEDTDNYSDLLAKEQYWISTLDTFNNGLNCTTGGEGVGVGEDHPSAKFTYDDYSAVVIYLAKTSMSLKEISEELELPLTTVKNIGYGITHTYLKLDYPIEYQLMQDKVGNRKTGPKVVYPDLRGPDGTVYAVTNLRAFAREHNLGSGNAGLTDLISGSVKAVKGFSLASTPVIKLINRTGEIIEVPISKDKRDFRAKYNLGAVGLRSLLSGAATEHKGWKIYNE